MNAGALRALEFDRIVEAVGRFALTPWGAARLAAAAAADGRRPSCATRWPRPARRCGCSADAPIDLRAAGDLDATLGCARRRRTRRSNRFSSSPSRISSRRSTPRPLPSAASRMRSNPAGHRRHGGVVRARDGGHPAEDRSRPATSSTTRVRSCGRCAIGCANSGPGCAARSSRTSAARTRRSIYSSRSSPIGTAATCSSSAPSIAPPFPASCTGVRAAARACFSSR